MNLWQRLRQNDDGSPLFDLPGFAPVLLLAGVGWAVWTALS